MGPVAALPPQASAPAPPEPEPPSQPEQGPAQGSNADAAAPDADTPLDAGAPKTGLWRLGELFDVGPAGPATAHESGILMVTRDNALLRAERHGDRFDAITESKAQFRPYARAAALLRGFAYWVNGRDLVRQRIDRGAPAEILTRDARHSTRVATPGETWAGPTAVAYVREPIAGSNELEAALWVEGRGALRLSPEGSNAHSVALAPSGHELLAVSVDPHMGMTPVNLRRIRFPKHGPKLDDNLVAWVGSGATPLTEIFTLLAPGNEAWALLGMQKDITHFGLAHFLLAPDRATGADASFIEYANGIDPAPIASGELCGKPGLLFARPESAKVRSAQTLELAWFLGERKLERSEAIARSRAFSDVSLRAIEGGAVIAYVADRRTWARVVHCEKR